MSYDDTPTTHLYTRTVYNTRNLITYRVVWHSCVVFRDTPYEYEHDNIWLTFYHTPYDGPLAQADMRRDPAGTTWEFDLSPKRVDDLSEVVETPGTYWVDMEDDAQDDPYVRGVLEECLEG